MEWTLSWFLWTCCSTPPLGKWTWWWTMPWWPWVETPTPTGPTWWWKYRPDDSLGDDRQPLALWLQGSAALGRAVARATGAQHKYLLGAVACWSVFHLMEFWLQAGNSCMHRGGHPGGTQGQGHSLWTAVPGEDPEPFGGPLVHVHGHQALHFSRRGHHSGCGWFVHQKNSYQDHHWPGELWSLCWCLAKESFQLSTYGPGVGLSASPGLQTWRKAFMTNHALLKCSGMYPSDWSNGLSVDQFLGGSILLSWDLMPDDSDGVAYLSSRHLGTIKASLRFAKPLLATTTLIAYAQYDNLVVADAYRSVTFDYNAFDWQLQ